MVLNLFGLEWFFFNSLAGCSQKIMISLMTVIKKMALVLLYGAPIGTLYNAKRSVLWSVLSMNFMQNSTIMANFIFAKACYGEIVSPKVADGITMNPARVLSISGQGSIYLRHDKVLHKNSGEVDGDSDLNRCPGTHWRMIWGMSKHLNDHRAQNPKQLLIVMGFHPLLLVLLLWIKREASLY